MLLKTPHLNYDMNCDNLFVLLNLTTYKLLTRKPFHMLNPDQTKRFALVKSSVLVTSTNDYCSDNIICGFLIHELSQWRLTVY